jgi:hypothetical protein
MAKNKLSSTAARIGAAVGKADRAAHETARKVVKASGVADKELQNIGKQVEALRKQLVKTTKRLKKALA